MDLLKNNTRARATASLPLSDVCSRVFVAGVNTATGSLLRRARSSRTSTCTPAGRATCATCAARRFGRSHSCCFIACDTSTRGRTSAASAHAASSRKVGRRQQYNTTVIPLHKSQCFTDFYYCFTVCVLASAIQSVI